MSPSIGALQTIAEDISLGFETLLEQLDAQRKVERHLRQQLAQAAERVGLPLSHISPLYLLFCDVTYL